METLQDADNVQLPALTVDGSSACKPSLLPAFEPLSSSPGLPRPLKRKFDGSPCSRGDAIKYYPTPVPTSSTNVFTSSPPLPQPTRPCLQRTVSTLSERVPLGAVPTLHVPADGEPVLMGRSSNASHYQLSANRLISRVHVRATYYPSSSSHPSGEVKVECLGWNGAKVHCRGKIHELGKGDSFSSDIPEANIMVDVQDTRVLLVWPPVEHKRPRSVTPIPTLWEGGESPTRPPISPLDRFASSPPPIHRRFQSPDSPTPAGQPTSAAATFLAVNPSDPFSKSPVKVYEDDDDGSKTPTPASQPASARPDSASGFEPFNASQSSALSEPDEFSDQDEENDPIVHSFGPFGDNLLPRMASFHAVSSPDHQRSPRKFVPKSPQCPPSSEAARGIEISPLKNHVVNQLAFSRLHSLPLSTLISNLPAELKGRCPSQTEKNLLTEPDLRSILDTTSCVGHIPREGKDAAGKPLEDEFYYVPEMDADIMRRDAVVGGMGKTGLRAVRRQHKQYYWKRPRY